MRKIEAKMIAFIDEKLKDNGLAQHAIAIKDPRLLMCQAASACVGIREATNNNDGPMVEMIQETIGGHENESWCMSFVQTMIAYAALKCGLESPIVASEGCLDVWNRTPISQRVKFVPLPGAIVIWRHGISSKGHTGLILASDGHIFQAVEGNTTSGSNDPNGPVEREGGGVYFTSRSHKGNGDMHIVGFLKPF
jgi:hypothetical protein